MKKRILLLSAYDARSHQQWRKSLVELFPDYAWTQLTLPPRHFNWRIRGNSLSLAFGQRTTLLRGYDLLLVTSMVDLSSLRGFVPELARIPTIVYCHENQFAYPASQDQYSSVEPQLTSLYTLLCADRVVFNSRFNQRSFIAGAEQLLNKLPDFVPQGILDRFRTSTVLPVPLPTLPDLQAVAGTVPADGSLLEVVWNHRWEYDKGPALLLAVGREIAKRRLPVRLHVAGESFRRKPEEFQLLQAVLKDHCQQLGAVPGHFGFIREALDYYTLLRQCHVVLSTALHDFQGLAVLEAIACGCTPLAPDQLAYPEYLPACCLYPRDTIEAETRSIVDTLASWQEKLVRGDPLPKTDLRRFERNALASDYRKLFEELGGESFSRPAPAEETRLPDQSAPG